MHNLIKTTLALCLLASLMLAGCSKSGDPVQQAIEAGAEVTTLPTGEVEVVAPLGCLKSKTRYYDPKLKECVKVDNQQQAVILDAYREINRNMAEGVEEGEYDIKFETYISIEQAESLWSELREKGAKMLVLSGLMPDGYGYDVDALAPPPPVGPKNWGKATHQAGCGWHHSFTAPSENNTIMDMLLKAIEAGEANPAYNMPHRPEARKAVLEDGLCRIYSMNILVRPEVMKEFWESHLELIRGVQPRISLPDKLMHTRLLGPVTPYTEETE